MRPPRLKGGVILSTFFLVDDQRVLLNLFQDMLSLNGHKVVGIAHNGQECIDQITALKRLPDIIVLDYRMPLLNGIETIKELLKLDPGLKIIVLSADSSAESQSLQAGAVKFLQKPVSFDTLLSEIKVLTNN